MAIRFIYFDVGNVLLHFDNHLLTKQVADLAGIAEPIAWRTFIETGLADRYESGQINNAEFFDEFWQALGSHPRPTLHDFSHAASAIFEVNATIKPIVSNLWAAGWRLGLLSNTNPMHWDYFTSGRYELLPHCFEVHALSFRLKAMKPDRVIYERAAELAGVPPREIFFVDDRPENVEGACEFGFDAVPYTTSWQLAEELRRRGIEFNF